MIKVLDQHVIDRVTKDYKPEDVDEVLTILADYGKEESETEQAFMRLAILRLANGNKRKLPGLVATAKWEYKDILGGVQYQYGLDWVEKYLNE